LPASDRQLILVPMSGRILGLAGGLAGLVLVAAGCGGGRKPAPLPSPREVAANELRDPSDFAAIADPVQRSRALFAELGRVLTHPRCLNCHPDGDSPHQGMALALHEPPVTRGPADHGVVGMECTSCHQDGNQDHVRVPGAPSWGLAPREMAWVGKSLRQICAQLKDPARNGGKTLAQIVEHNTHDALVGWGWAPGADREPAPGTQARFGALTAAWVESGAHCPEEDAP
jgi:hypothetical protein